MKPCIRWAAALLATALSMTVPSALAYYHHDHGPSISINVWRGGYWNHGYYHGRMGWWWVAGGAWYFYSAPVYPYPNMYAPPVVAIPLAPAAPIAPPPPAEAPAPAATSQVWYYCKPAKQYYPYVTECPSGWKTVPAQPSK